MSHSRMTLCFDLRCVVAAAVCDIEDLAGSEPGLFFDGVEVGLE